MTYEPVCFTYVLVSRLITLYITNKYNKLTAPNEKYTLAGFSMTLTKNIGSIIGGPDRIKHRCNHISDKSDRLTFDYWLCWLV